MKQHNTKRQTIDIGTNKKHGQCSLVSEHEKLGIVLPRALFGGKQKLLRLGLVDNAKNRRLAINKLEIIQNDIDAGQFDPTLERYKPQAQKQDYLANTPSKPKITLVELWTKFYEYKRPILKPKTIRYYDQIIESYIKKSGIDSPYKALELRGWLLKTSTQSMAKRVLIYVNAAFEWGLKHGLVDGKNPFKGMPNELRHHYQDHSKPNAFTTTQKQAIIEAFGTSHYSYFVQFLFATGCRPGEAVSLTWSEVLDGFRKIRFCGKTKRVREFPCNQQLQDLLREIKTENAKPTDLVFLSPEGKQINYDNFSRRYWANLVDPIKPDTTPYCCRDTFITEQILKGVSATIVAKWCDNSTQTIEKHYFDILNNNHVLP